MSTTLTEEQNHALEAIRAFMLDETRDAFILRGSAGTGKTTLIARLVDNLKEMNKTCALLAPTGRAARILGSKIKGSTPATTIHACIYLLDEFIVVEEASSANDPGIRMIFPCRKDESLLSLLIVDESSMVGDKKNQGDVIRFGSGRLLHDLIQYARSNRPGRNEAPLIKLLFVGDPAQLPPIGENDSPALSDDYLSKTYGLKVDSFDLTTVMRQAKGSHILDRATELRDTLLKNCFNTFSLQPYGQDIEKVTPNQAISQIVQNLKDNQQPSVAIVHSNKAALEYNRSIRDHLWGDANLPIQIGDILLVNRNNHVQGFNNGDLVKVTDVAQTPEQSYEALKGQKERVLLSFRKLTVAYREANGEVTRKRVLVLENLLNSPEREIQPLEQRALLVHFRKRHSGLNPKSNEFRQTINNDPYFNALQVKYGYAMTCHKAQGGEWDTAIVDFSSMSVGRNNENFFRWAYTAITRASRCLMVVSPPEFSPTTGINWSNSKGNGPTTSDTLSPQPALEELQADADWQRYYFTPEMAPLMHLHQRLRSVWGMQDIAVEQLQHLQYCERYTLTRHDCRAVVQYWYNGKYKPSRANAVPGAGFDPQLANDALLSLQSLINTPDATQPTNGAAASLQKSPPEDPFIAGFLAQLDAALTGTGIQRTAHKSMPYRLRVQLADASRRAEIDFSYNGKQQWTSALEVGGRGSSRGLLEEIRQRMDGQGDQPQ